MVPSHHASGSYVHTTLKLSPCCHHMFKNTNWDEDVLLFLMWCVKHLLVVIPKRSLGNISTQRSSTLFGGLWTTLVSDVHSWSAHISCCSEGLPSAQTESCVQRNECQLTDKRCLHATVSPADRLNISSEVLGYETHEEVVNLIPNRSSNRFFQHESYSYDLRGPGLSPKDKGCVDLGV